MRSKRQLSTIKAFDSDYKKLRKRHYDTNKFQEPFRALIENDADLLKTKYSDHALTGNWKGFRELHVEADLLVVYYVDGDAISLVLVRTGTHDTLFSERRTTRKMIEEYKSAVRKPVR